MGFEIRSMWSNLGKKVVLYSDLLLVIEKLAHSHQCLVLAPTAVIYFINSLCIYSRGEMSILVSLFCHLFKLLYDLDINFFHRSEQDKIYSRISGPFS